MSLRLVLLFFTLLLNLFENNECYKVLITLPGVSGSQSLAMFRLADSLGGRGNNVTILSYEIYSNVQKPSLKYAKEISFNVIENQETLQTMQSNTVNSTWNTLTGDEMPIRRFIPFFRTLSKGCDKLLQDDVLLDKLKSLQFDVVIIHYMDFCSFGLAHHLGIEGTVFMSTAYMLDPFAWYSGSPNTFSYIVSGLHDTTDKMNLYHRARNLALGTVLYVAFQYGISWTYTDLFRKHFGPEFPSLNDLMYSTDLFYINSDPFFEYPRPLMPHVIYIGGFTMKKAEPLTEDWQKIVDQSGEHGVVVFSLGSVANTKFMPQDLKEVFYFAFKRLPQRVIWRFEGELPEPKGKASNIFTVDWLPQKDLLAHPKVKAFITHGGYNSLTEATYLGVPLIVFPLFGDQFGNCKRVERLNIGVSLDRSILSEETVYQALQKVLYSEEIQNNARQLGRMIRSKPTSSHELAVKWIEYLAEFKNLDQLKPASLQLNIFQYFLIDILLSMILIFVLFLWLSRQFFRCCCCKCKSKVKRE